MGFKYRAYSLTPGQLNTFFLHQPKNYGTLMAKSQHIHLKKGKQNAAKLVFFWLLFILCNQDNFRLNLGSDQHSPYIPGTLTLHNHSYVCCLKSILYKNCHRTDIYYILLYYRTDIYYIYIYHWFLNSPKYPETICGTSAKDRRILQVLQVSQDKYCTVR